MLLKTLSACLLVAATVFVHVVGLVTLLELFVRAEKRPPTRFWPITWLLIRVTWFLLLVHMIEITIWGLFYIWSGCMPNPQNAFYFSGVTYSTVGYGDLVLPDRWQILSPIEGLTGILMCGLSTGVFFLVVTRLFADLRIKNS